MAEDISFTVLGRSLIWTNMPSFIQFTKDFFCVSTVVCVCRYVYAHIHTHFTMCSGAYLGQADNRQQEECLVWYVVVLEVSVSACRFFAFIVSTAGRDLL